MMMMIMMMIMVLPEKSTEFRGCFEPPAESIFVHET
jgi:hypothetical protein